MTTIGKTAQVLINGNAKSLFDAGLITGDEYRETIQRMKVIETKDVHGKPELLTRKEASGLMKISTRTLDRIIKDGILRKVSIGRRSKRLLSTEVYSLMTNDQGDREEVREM